jgi:Holliday junction resolvasome RuvABC endonuclease subunit
MHVGELHDQADKFLKVHEEDLGLFSTRSSREIVLGLDTSLTSFGVAALSTNGFAYAWTLRPADLKKITTVERLNLLVFGLRRILTRISGWDNFIIGLALLEGYGFAAQRAHSLGEIGGATKLLLYDLGIEMVEPVSPNTLKQFVTGVGKGDKDEIRLAAYKRWGVEFKYNDAVDAYCLSRAALGIYTGQVETAKDRDVLAKHVERPGGWQLKPQRSLKQISTPRKRIVRRMT